MNDGYIQNKSNIVTSKIHNAINLVARIIVIKGNL